MKTNIYSGIPKDLPEELIEVISENKEVRIERIVSRAHRSPEGFWYDQEENEFVLLVSGEAELLFEEENESVRMEAGDYLVIPAHKRHRVAWTAPDRETVWLAVHFKLAPSALI
ncbi:MAG: cupin domain-containing protein [Candidatus Auribacterota bacterium]|nr:cupin domain-containing protein [Candidatus Auribacterota bacterium]